MAANTTTIPADAILNPYTPLAFLPPGIADQYQLLCYVYVATFAAYAWDWIIAIPEEYMIFRRTRFSLPIIAYLMSRIGCLACILATIIFRIAPIDNCRAPRLAQIITFEIGGPATSLLFLFRVKAVYNHSRVVTVFFSLLWLCIAGLTLSTLLTIGISADHIPYTRRCIYNIPNVTEATIPTIVTAAFDTLVFLAISYRMVAIAMQPGSAWSARAKLFFTGDGLYCISKSLLQSGQVYYLSTIVVAIISTASMLSPGISEGYRFLVGGAYFSLASAMACRVFRSVFLGTISDLQESTCRFPSAFHAAASNPLGNGGGSISSRRKSGLALTFKSGVGVKEDTTMVSSDKHTIQEQELTTADVQKDAANSV